jgi:hypothetical protein
VGDPQAAQAPDQLFVLAKLKMNEGLSPKDIKHNETCFAIAHGEARLFVEGLGTFEAIDCLLGLAEAVGRVFDRSALELA